MVLSGERSGRGSPDEIIVVNPFGMAIEDIAIATRVLETARQRNIATVGAEHAQVLECGVDPRHRLQLARGAVLQERRPLLDQLADCALLQRQLAGVQERELVVVGQPVLRVDRTQHAGGSARWRPGPS